MRAFFFSILSFIAILNIHAQDNLQIGSNEVYDFCFSANGTLVYLTNGKSVNIWDIQKNMQVGSLEDGPQNTIISIAISKDSAFLVASSLDSTISIWSLSNLKLFKRIKINSIANTVLFSTNNFIIAGLRNGDLLSINSYTGDILAQKKTTFLEVTCIAIQDSLSLLAASGSNGDILLLNPTDFSISSQIKAHTNFIRGLVFNYDSRFLYSCGDDGKVICWSIRNKSLKLDSYVLHGILKPWVMTVDLLKPAQIAFANIRGEVFIRSYPFEYYFQIKGKIFKVHFLPVTKSKIVIGIGTNQGLQIIWTSTMKFKTY